MDYKSAGIARPGIPSVPPVAAIAEFRADHRVSLSEFRDRVDENFVAFKRGVEPKRRRVNDNSEEPAAIARRSLQSLRVPAGTLDGMASRLVTRIVDLEELALLRDAGAKSPSVEDGEASRWNECIVSTSSRRDSRSTVRATTPRAKTVALAALLGVMLETRVEPEIAELLLSKERDWRQQQRERLLAEQRAHDSEEDKLLAEKRERIATFAAGELLDQETTDNAQLATTDDVQSATRVFSDPSLRTAVMTGKYYPASLLAGTLGVGCDALRKRMDRGLVGGDKDHRRHVSKDATSRIPKYTYLFEYAVEQSKTPRKLSSECPAKQKSRGSRPAK